MAIEIKTQTLFPVRRDKQIATSINYSAGSGGAGSFMDSSIDLTGLITESSLNIGFHQLWQTFFGMLVNWK